MASDNNNINSLASEAADADTSELEILSVDLIPTDEELEMDADTFSLDDREPDQRSVECLRSDLKSRDERISSLQFDIEQLRSRWSGLEKEIEAREDLTEMLQADLKAAQKNLVKKDKELSRLQRDVDKLESQLARAADLATGRDDSMATLEAQIDELTSRSAQDADHIRSLEAKLAEAADVSVQSTDPGPEGDDDSGPISRAGRQLSRWARLAKLQHRFDQQARELQETRSAQGRLDAKLTTARTENTDLRAQLDAARIKVRAFEKKQDDDQRLIAEQRGQIAGYTEKLRTLDDRLSRSEKYTDGLRRKIEQADEQRSAVLKTLETLDSELAAARQTIGSLETQLDEARETIDTLEDRVSTQRSDFDREVATLRIELGEAQDTIATQDTINEKLACDLAERESTRRQLAEQVETLAKNQDTQIESLRNTNQQLERALEDAEEKITNKDKAISALLNELANKSRSIESIEEIEHVIHEIDGRMSERIDESSGNERERPTRLLTGSVDGQELRFPLFKNRLTIGRTTHNDIQLRAQYISRRHAVIMVDDDVTRIVDWGSKNGVYVNSSRVSEKTLTNGDVISIGMAEFVYEERPRRESS